MAAAMTSSSHEQAMMHRQSLATPIETAAAV